MITYNNVVKYIQFVFNMFGYVPTSAKIVAVGILVKAGVSKGVIISFLCLL
jgi:hypothetical protein